VPSTRAASRTDGSSSRGLEARAASDTRSIAREEARDGACPGTSGGGPSRAAELEAEAHVLFAHAHELLAEAARVRKHREAASGDLVTLEIAASLAATSVRVVRDAIRTGDLPAYGGQRDRPVRASDLAAWIESRRLVLDGPADGDIERRMGRLAKRSKEQAA
jgi:hypothetical protein